MASRKVRVGDERGLGRGVLGERPGERRAVGGLGDRWRCLASRALAACSAVAASRSCVSVSEAADWAPFLRRPAVGSA